MASNYNAVMGAFLLDVYTTFQATAYLNLYRRAHGGRDATDPAEIDAWIRTADFPRIEGTERVDPYLVLTVEEMLKALRARFTFMASMLPEQEEWFVAAPAALAAARVFAKQRRLNAEQIDQEIAERHSTFWEDFEQQMFVFAGRVKRREFDLKGAIHTAIEGL